MATRVFTSLLSFRLNTNIILTIIIALLRPLLFTGSANRLKIPSLLQEAGNGLAALGRYRAWIWKISAKESRHFDALIPGWIGRTAFSRWNKLAVSR